MAQRDFVLTLDMVRRAAKVVNGFESEAVQLRVLEALLAALAAPGPHDDGEPHFADPGAVPGAGQGEDASPQPAAGPSA
jgi:hypothetical protein